MEHLSIDFVKKQIGRIVAAGFDHAEVIVTNDHMTEMQIDFSDFAQLRNTESDQVILRGTMGGRYASIALNQTDEVSLQAAVQLLQEAAQAAPVDPARQFAPSQLIPINAMGPLEPLHYQMHERLSRFLKEVADTYPECHIKQALLRYIRTRTLRSNTEGLEIDSTEGCYNLGVQFLSKRNGKTSSINYSGAYANDLDVELIEWGGIRRAIESSSREIAAVPFKGELVGPIVIAPEAFAVLLNSWFSHLRDEHMIAGTSKFKNSLGKPVASPLLTIGIEPRNSAFARQEFMTEDGYGSEPSTILQNGILRSHMLSDYGAKKTNLARAENSGRNWVIEGGDASLADLFGDIERGLFIGRLSGAVPAANGDFSIVAKNSFLIEDGFISKPVSELIISGNLFAVLSAVTSVSRERASDGQTMIPWIVVDGLTAHGR
jgi:PmbA protein